MIACKELNTSQCVLDSALRLLSLDPTSVLKDDLKEKELFKGYQLFAADDQGIFGTATLTERPMKTLNVVSKNNLNFLGEDTYYELSLIHQRLPKEMQHTLKSHSYQYFVDHYCHLFYQELFYFLSRHTQKTAIVVNTTQDISKKMSTFGFWDFQNISLQNESFYGVVDLIQSDSPNQDNVGLQSIQKGTILH